MLSAVNSSKRLRVLRLPHPLTLALRAALSPATAVRIGRSSCAVHLSSVPYSGWCSALSRFPFHLVRCAWSVVFSMASESCYGNGCLFWRRNPFYIASPKAARLGGDLAVKATPAEAAALPAVEAVSSDGVAENQGQQPQNAMFFLLVSCRKLICSHDLEDQRVYSPLCFRPLSKWALTSSWTAEISCILLRPESECLNACLEAQNEI